MDILYQFTVNVCDSHALHCYLSYTPPPPPPPNTHKTNTKTITYKNLSSFEAIMNYDILNTYTDVLLCIMND